MPWGGMRGWLWASGAAHPRGVRLRLPFPRALAACALGACLVAVAWAADCVSIACVELRAASGYVVVVVDLVCVTDAVGSADLAAAAVALQHFRS